MKKFMLPKKKTGMFLLILTLGICSGSFAQKQEVKQNYSTILFNTGKMMELFHFTPQLFNDVFSAAVFESYFSTLDPQKKLFLQSDINQLRQFQFLIDDEIRSSTEVKFFRAANEIYRLRITEAQSMCKQVLDQKLSFTQNEFYNSETKDLAFPASISEKKKRWYLSTKYQVLNQLEDQLTGLSEEKQKTQTDSLEQRSRSIVLASQERYFKTLLTRTEEEEAFSIFLNTVIHQFDPHSGYYLPVDRREFVEGLSGVYYGIGALLKDEGGKIGIGELMIGGPAWRSGQVEKGDIIVKVAQDSEKPVSVEGLAMSELIKLTRGKKDSKITITFRKADGTLRDVAMIRTALHMEDTFVKTAVIHDSLKKIGYISLPKFYTSFGDANGRSCADDMEKALLELKEQQVDGIVIDIRDNGGGSLGEVIEMVGLFVDQGPVVQVRSRGDKSEVGRMNKKKVYDGPLAILVNELSASASEIFAGAIQDYQRGIIIGSNSTYGKGTVQRPYQVPGNNWNEPLTKDLGTVHVTVQKYYRVTGNSTQLKGVVSDIKLPGFYEHFNVREKDTELPLAWDEIKGVAFRPAVHSQSFDLLKAKSFYRLNADSAIQALKTELDKISDKDDIYPLEQEAFRKYRADKKDNLAQIRKLSALQTLMDIRNTPEEEANMGKKEAFRQENNKAWLRNLQKDRYLSEAVAVVKDMTEPAVVQKQKRPF